MSKATVVAQSVEFWRLIPDIWESVYKYLDASDIAQWNYVGDLRLRHLLTAVKRREIIYHRNTWHPTLQIPLCISYSRHITKMVLLKAVQDRYTISPPAFNIFLLPETLRILRFSFSYRDGLSFTHSSESERKEIQKRVSAHFAYLEEYRWLYPSPAVEGCFWALPPNLKRFQTVATKSLTVLEMPPGLEEYTQQNGYLLDVAALPNTLQRFMGELRPGDTALLPRSLTELKYAWSSQFDLKKEIGGLPSLLRVLYSPFRNLIDVLHLLPPTLTEIGTVWYAHRVTSAVAQLMPRSLTYFHSIHTNESFVEIDALPFLPPGQLSLSFSRTFTLQKGLIARLPKTLTHLDLRQVSLPCADFALLPPSLTSLYLPFLHNKSAKGIVHLKSLTNLQIHGGTMSIKGYRCLPKTITRLQLERVSILHPSAFHELPPCLTELIVFGHKNDTRMADPTAYEKLPVSLRFLHLKVLDRLIPLGDFSPCFSRLVQLSSLTIEGAHVPWPCTFPPKLQYLTFPVAPSTFMTWLPSLPKTIQQLRFKGRISPIASKQLRTYLPNIEFFQGGKVYGTR